jgi:hypothetical protein
MTQETLRDAMVLWHDPVTECTGISWIDFGHGQSVLSWNCRLCLNAVKRIRSPFVDCFESDNLCPRCSTSIRGTFHYTVIKQPKLEKKKGRS